MHPGFRKRKTGPAEDSEAELYKSLLAGYAAISARRSGAVEASALRHQAPSYRDILAYQATGNKFTYTELKDQIKAKRDIRKSVKSILRLGALARVVLLQNINQDDVEVGEALLVLVVEWLSVEKSHAYRRMLIQLLILNGDFHRAAGWLGETPELDESSHRYLRSDTMNPFVTQDLSMAEAWIEQFNAPFSKYNLLPIEVAGKAEVPFNSLSCHVPDTRGPVIRSDKKVSVIFTSYQPQRSDIYTAVGSIINQTWTNLEIVVVNDSSGPEYEPVFDEIASLDPRIRVISTPENVGTYGARNLGFENAQGDYLTGHDDDDWSHPQRIEIQVAFLEANRGVAGCRVYSIACDENLLMTRLGKSTPVESNASTLMLPSEVWDQVGGFLPVRKAGDTELYLRIERLTQKNVHDLKVPLTVIRKAAGSLSNSEFRAGWSHPARRNFKTSYKHWHENASDAELALNEGAPPNLSVPHRFQVAPDGDASRFDVIFAGDWHPFGGPQRSMLEEVKALLAAGKRVGVMHLEPARFMSSKERSIGTQILELINTGQVSSVLYDDPAVTDLLILRYPPIMQFPPAEPSNVEAGKVVIVANQAPEELDGSDIRYIPSMVQKHTESAFNAEVSWVPQSDMVRERLENRLADAVLEEFNFPGILNIDEWFVERDRFRSTLPVVGRHSRDDSMKWPERAVDIRAAYPLDGTFDIRILGGAKSALQGLKRSTIPGGWTVYGKNYMTPQKFLKTLDFYVFFQHSNAVEAFGRSILEAIASGLVVILPDKFRPVFGEAAVYATADQTVDVIREFYQNRSKYVHQVQKSRKFVQANFSYSSYCGQIDSMLKEINEATI